MEESLDTLGVLFSHAQLGNPYRKDERHKLDGKKMKISSFEVFAQISLYALSFVNGAIRTHPGSYC